MATEQIIHPISPPPNAPRYYYPGFYYYTPEPYQTTYIPKHHHHVIPSPLKHAVHDFVHPFGGEGGAYQLPAPHCDIRETRDGRYHIDVELPGLRDKRDVTLKWTGTRSLFVDARIQREKIDVEEEEGEESVAAAAAPSATTTTTHPTAVDGDPAGKSSPTSSSSSPSSSDENDKKQKKKKTKKNKKSKRKGDEKKVYFLKKERKVGELARSFNFPVDVEQDETVAKLAHGVLSIVVPKKKAKQGDEGEDEEGHKHVEIEQAGH